MQIETIKSNELKYFEGNPRQISKEELEKLKNSIKRFGFVDPIIIDENNVVLGGNQRLTASRELSISEVPCVRVTNLNPNEKASLNIALNKISGDWDDYKLSEILRKMKNEDAKLLNLTGFDEDEITNILSSDEYYEAPIEREFDEDSIDTKNKCPKCGYEW